MSETFHKDLNSGQQAEDFVINVFEAHGYEIIQRAENYFPDYDFACLNREGEVKSVEVKYDRQTERTGNIFVEAEALQHSKADILIYCIGQPIKELYFLKLQDTLIRARSYPFNVNGGDKKAYGWLFPKARFIQEFKPKIVEV